MDLGSAAAAARDALEKAKRAAMFQRQIQEQMNKLKNQGLAAGFLPGEGPKARKLILDEFGRELDEDGNVVPMKPSLTSTLKVNQGGPDDEDKPDPMKRKAPQSF